MGGWCELARDRPWQASADGLVAYDAQVQRERRALAETALALIVHPQPRRGRGRAAQGVARHGAVLAAAARAAQRAGSGAGIHRASQERVRQHQLRAGGTSDQIPAELDAEIHYQLAALFYPKPRA